MAICVSKIEKSDVDNLKTMKSVLKKYYPDLDIVLSDFSETEYKYEIDFENEKDYNDYAKLLVPYKIRIGFDKP